MWSAARAKSSGRNRRLDDAGAETAPLTPQRTGRKITRQATAHDGLQVGPKLQILGEASMLKWKIAAVLGAAFGAAGVTWGYAQQSQAPGFYELRVYTALPGKRDALAERFASRTAAIFARHGITNVGYWIPQESDPELGISAENTFIYIRGYPSKEERDKRLKARADDPEFTEVVRKAESNPATKLIAKVHNIDMVPHGPYTAITLAK
jgi:hypothetical protein